ncbi:MAG TPA: hypothetical protein VJT08_15815 [Terriglobales bacterium]|nr:hypothetical protein [Terriglobales bacterium]
MCAPGSLYNDELARKAPAYDPDQETYRSNSQSQEYALELHTRCKWFVTSL